MKDCIRSLKNGKSRGPDLVSAESVKLLMKGNLTDTMILFNEMYKDLVIPNTWKRGVLTSIYKGKGTLGDPSNERGITVTCVPLKLMEKLIYTEIVKEINISDRQAGGRANMSTLHHLFTINTIIKNTQREKTYLSLILLDVEKAFDKACFKSILLDMRNKGALLN